MSRAAPSLPLLEWHRRRRREGAGELDAGSETPVAEPLLLPDGHGLPVSPLTCASPAGILREDLIRRNARQVRSEYDFDGCLGEGSFGKVFRGTHRRAGTRRAVKEIPKAGTESAEFEWELQALVALDHPHVVNCIEYFVDMDNYYLVMELCTGPDLFAYIVDSTQDSGGTGFVPEREVSVILRQCLKAALCCHANGFVHRDLNARNFMFTGEDRSLKLIDFGLATRFLGNLPEGQFTEIVGTSHYMAPEMMLNGQYSPAADLWSLGVLFYVSLTGVMLLPKDDERKRAWLRKGKHVENRLQKCPSLQRREASQDARHLLGRMLQHDPSSRITASEALSHPFICSYERDYIGPPMDLPFDRDVIGKLRLFAKAPRLKKVALLTVAHLVEHEQDLLVAQHNFRTMDADGDGRLSLGELQAALASNGVQEPADLVEVFSACDSQRAGSLSLVDFLAALLPASLIDERLCHEAFNVLDPECKGRLTAKDLQSMCPAYDLGRCEQMVCQADPSGKGHFDFEDFHSFLRGADGAPVAESLRKVARHC